MDLWGGVWLNSPHNYLLPYFTEHFSLSLLEKVKRSRKGVKEIEGGLLAVLCSAETTISKMHFLIHPHVFFTMSFHAGLIA